MSNPTLISVPFANGGNKNTIQTTRQVGQDAQDATWTDGFPSITMTPISAGGKPPKGLDFNGIFYALSDNVVHRLKGLSVQFSATYATAIGGYPMYAKLQLNDGSAIVESTVDNNMTDPNSSMTGWRVYSSYSLLNGKLDIAAYQKSTNIISAASGTTDAITASYTPAIAALTNGMSLFIRATSANATTTPTFTPNSGVIAAKTIVKGAGQALLAGDIAGAGHWIELQYDSTLDKWVLLNPATYNQFGSLLSANGYKKIPDINSPTGYYIHQWGFVGYTDIVNSLDIAVTFPLTFPNALLNTQITAETGQPVIANFFNPTTSGFTARLTEYNRSTSGGIFRYFVIGY